MTTPTFPAFDINGRPDNPNLSPFFNVPNLSDAPSPEPGYFILPATAVRRRGDRMWVKSAHEWRDDCNMSDSSAGTTCEVDAGRYCGIGCYARAIGDNPDLCARMRSYASEGNVYAERPPSCSLTSQLSVAYQLNNARAEVVRLEKVVKQQEAEEAAAKARQVTVTVDGQAYTAEYHPGYVQFGCAKIDNRLIRVAYELFTQGEVVRGLGNRHIEAVRIGRGEFTRDQLVVMVPQLLAERLR